jgi:urease accessory protein
VIARTSAVVDTDAVLGELHCESPLTLRQVHADEPGCCALCLVGTAAGPLAGDDLTLSLRLRPRARATLHATGASLAQGREGVPGSSAVRIELELGDRASLRADPGALIVCAGGRVEVSVQIALGQEASLDWSELIILGRSGESPGAATLRWDITRGERTVLRQVIDLGDPNLAAWSGMLAGRRVLASAVLAGPSIAAHTVVATSTAVAQRIDEQTVLVTVLSDDAAEAKCELAALRASITG